MERPGELVVYRSRDLTAREEFQLVWRQDEIEWRPRKVAAPVGDGRDAGWARFARSFWDVTIAEVRTVPESLAQQP